MQQDELDERVMVLLKGRVKVSSVDRDGRETILGIRDPGDLLGELGFIDRQPRIASVTALEVVLALAVPAQAFRAHLHRFPRVAGTLLDVVTRRMRESTLASLSFARADTMGRLASRILELADRYGERTDTGIVTALPISQEELAAWTGASRAGVGQCLQTMRELGWIETQRRRLIVKDQPALRSRVDLY